jgi:hypothetical protein
MGLHSAGAQQQSLRMCGQVVSEASAIVTFLRTREWIHPGDPGVAWLQLRDVHVRAAHSETEPAS